MSFDWTLAFFSLAGGLVLLIGLVLAIGYEKTIFAPAPAMLLTWGAALVILSFLPLMGFYHLSPEAVLLYILGAGWFAFLAILTSLILSKHSRTVDHRPGVTADQLDYRRLLMFWTLISVFAYPLAVLNVLNFGSNIVEISYNIRIASVSGESILDPIVSNLFVLLGVVANIVLFGVIQKKVKVFSFIVLVVPLVVINLIVSGRSGLVSMILGWVVIVAVFSDKLKLRYLALPILFLLFVLYFGGVWVKKFDVEGQSAANAVLVLAEHIFGYLYQGPILFSRYFTSEIDVATNWDFLNSACHLISKISMCTPNDLHAEFANYGGFRSGNVYSIYFSIIPTYGILGMFVVFSIYAIFLSIAFNRMKAKKIFAIVVYPMMFSAVVLSVYKDGIGYEFYWILKVLFICIFLRFLFVERNTRFINLVPKL